MINKLSFAVASDIHLGHPKTTTEEILANLEKAFPTSKETEELDIIFLTGDVFDRLLSFPDDSVTEIESWVNNFLRRCKDLDVVVRVLEGTPSHDWKQSNVFEKVNKIGKIGCDVKHVKTLSIEHIERFNKTVLYVPDEWEPEPDDTWKQVKDLLSINGLEKVDFAMMHGTFPHQLPPHVKVPMHDPSRYLSIVKYIVAIGHIHKPAIYERIYTPGSFDRLGHGEEEAKGHIRFYLKENDEWSVNFIENTGAKLYKTINCLGLNIDTALEKITAIASKMPKKSFIRIEADKEDAIVVSLDTLRTKFPDIVWDTKMSTKNKSGKEMLLDMRAKFRGLDITKDNLYGLLMERLANKNIDETTNQHCGKILSEVIANVRS